MKKMPFKYSNQSIRANSSPAVILAIMVLVVILVFAGCKGSTVSSTASTTPGGPGGGAIINSDSIVTAKIQAIRQMTSGYPWELDVLIQSSEDVGTLPNPAKDSVGKVITVKTDEDMSKFKTNDLISAKIKYTGDVPKPGITLYIYNIALR